MREKIKQFVKKWMEGHESDTFVRNEHGACMYSAGHSTLNLELFFGEIVEDALLEFAGQKEGWTDSDIDAAYIAGMSNSFLHKIDVNDKTPTVTYINNELERLKSLGFDRPYKAVKAIRKPIKS